MSGFSRSSLVIVSRPLRSLLRDKTLNPRTIRSPGMQFVFTIRSDRAHARIIRLEAQGLPEGIVFIDASALAEGAALRIEDDSMPILAAETVRYVGEPIGLLVGPDMDALREAVSCIRCTYEEFPALLGPTSGSDESLYQEVHRSCGDIEEAFGSAADTILTAVDTGLQEHFYADPHSAFARVANDGCIEVTTATQWLHHVQQTVSSALGQTEKRVRVHGIDAGPTLEGKVWFPSLVAAHAALAASVTGLPCVLAYSRAEDLFSSPKRPAGSVRIRTALLEDNSVAGADVQIDYDGGAYPVFSAEMLQRLLVAALGAYQIPALRVSVRCHTTNTAPAGPFSGMDALAWLGAERWIGDVAVRTGTEPVELRLRMLPKQDQTLMFNDFADAREQTAPLLKDVVERSDFRRKFAAYELQRKQRSNIVDHPGRTNGIGISLTAQGSGFSGRREDLYPSSVTLRLDQDGHAWIATSARASTSVIHGYWVARVCDVLGIDADTVHIAGFDTDTAPPSGPNMISRVTMIHTRLLEQCLQAVRKKRFQKPLPIEITRSWRRARKQVWDADACTGMPYPERSWAACVVEVEADPITFEARVTSAHIVAYTGKVIDPKSARNSLATAAVHAITWAGRESALVGPRASIARDGPVWFSSPFRNEPPVTVILVEDGAQANPLGLGELAFSCVPAAYASALSQALGVSVERLPSTAGNQYLAAGTLTRSAGDDA